MNFFWNKKANDFNKNHSEIISLLEYGELQTIAELLWQPSHTKIEYLPIVFYMVQKLKKPTITNQNLKIHKTIDKGNYQLLIFEVPWLDIEVKYSPVIFDKLTSKIVGIMLPFNELHEFLSPKQNADIGHLGMEWTGFILSKQLGI
ncbi:MAG: hypothetical protein IPP48_03260 [Chitinophagaceae bacterium]|nr:hypothetical protein [Chitinophagaceae bacterium]